jgi:hypothetical protein
MSISGEKSSNIHDYSSKGKLTAVSTVLLLERLDGARNTGLARDMVGSIGPKR